MGNVLELIKLRNDVGCPKSSILESMLTPVGQLFNNSAWKAEHQLNSVVIGKVCHFSDLKSGRIGDFTADYKHSCRKSLSLFS